MLRIPVYIVLLLLFHASIQHDINSQCGTAAGNCCRCSSHPEEGGPKMTALQGVPGKKGPKGNKGEVGLKVRCCI